MPTMEKTERVERSAGVHGAVQSRAVAMVLDEGRRIIDFAQALGIGEVVFVGR